MSSDCLYYFSRSVDKYPGTGANESVSSPDRYCDLSKIKNWRQMLSNFWTAPFDIGGIKFNTVEHMFQGYKINLASPEQGYLFSLNSDSSLSKASGQEAQKNRKMVTLLSEQLRSWDNIKESIIYSALFAKFSQHSELKNMLLLTHDAELWHGTPRNAPSRQYSLELVRSQLLAIELKVIVITFVDARHKLMNDEIEKCTIDKKFQSLVGHRTSNTIITLYGKDENIFLVEAKFDRSTNQIHSPDI